MINTIRTILKYFICTRIFFLMIILISINRYSVKEYDKSNHLINSLIQDNHNITTQLYNDEINSKKIINFENENFIYRNTLNFLKYFYSYDSVHFLHLSKYGRTNEKNFVFFPLFPMVISYITNFIMNFISLKYEMMLFLIIGFILNNLICFVNGILLIR